MSGDRACHGASSRHRASRRHGASRRHRASRRHGAGGRLLGPWDPAPSAPGCGAPSAPGCGAPTPRPLVRVLRRLREGEEGQTLLLGIGLISVVLALLLTVAAATEVYLDVKRLTSAADSAAAAAADGVGSGGYYVGTVSTSGSDTGAVPGALSDEAVREAAVQDVSTQEVLMQLEDVRVVEAYASGGDTAVVTLTARSRPSFLPWGIIPSEGFEITATSTARVTTVGR